METLSRLAQPPKIEPLPDVAEQQPLDRDFDDFLALFEDLRGLAPMSFFLLFKIARVIKTSDGKLSRQLKGFWDVCRSTDRLAQIENEKPAPFSSDVPIFEGHDPHFGERRIKGVEEIGQIKPIEVAIEEFTDLLYKAKERQLNVRVLLRGGEQQASLETAPIRDRGSRQMGNAAEQKLYILLDRSYSMWEKHRLLYAKVLAIEFLRRKKGTGARLFYRAYDFDVYEIEKVLTATDFDALTRKLLFIEPGGKGTDIQLAIMTAVRDIKFDGMLEGAEILLITDGCDRIEVDTVKEALSGRIKLHMVKIGRDSPEPAQAEVKEMIEKDQSIAGLNRDRIAVLYKEQLMKQWNDVTTTLLETDDLDSAELQIGPEEVSFALDAAEKVLQIGDLPTTAEIESAFRKASFVEGFLSFLLEREESSAAVAARKSDIQSTGQRLSALKLRLAAKNQMLANLLANKDLVFVTDNKLRKQAKKANLTMEDLARLQDSQDLYVKLKLGGSGAPGGEGQGISLWKLMGMIAKSTAQAVTGWLVGRDKDAEEPPSAEPPDKEQPQD